ncbi:hypothetical protein BSK20_04970 [SR1 bacterium human oral taxon HOT-345]|nr:hypothetical protein BSK20_04970 [SR1 bacterium human oral taxon HOT-345]
MNSNPKLKDLYQLITELHTLAHRETLNKPLYFFSRRQKAQVAKFLTELYYEQKLLSEDTYKDIKKNLNLIFFENFSQQILPATTGIIASAYQKKEMYLNTSKVLGRDILEPREYIGIVPEVASDLDAPSLVTAETPPNYQQPWHDHGENREITFYTGSSISKFKTEGIEHEIQADFGDIIIFPPKTWHTIKNPTDYPVMNLSVKLPSALLDRGKVYQGSVGQGEKRTLDQKADHVFGHDLNDLEMPYHIRVYVFDEGKSEHIVSHKGKSLLYPLEGEYLATTQYFKNKTFRKGDTLLLDAETEASITNINGKGKIYTVILKENRAKQT